ncbi:ribosome hibernation-promoting factor, HPF/YfiA family [Stratiformator vulcanicus]|uniref:Ribosome hibernation promoting factor HPF n=1 Tax=Stratiformator vulcanicus TaxID=2527980 RepID=A0A517R455_9PLAN|nr:ribosome-associated translation inhibitor RaiA [Stratiformator vulcanicus]QDT38658.1 ribosome hibernation promoting factor HPF [Stratiformator vulcanicus]
MQIEVAVRHGSLRDEIRDLIVRKSEKLVTYFERVTAINVTVEFAGERVKTELLVDAEHKHDFVASTEGDEIVSTFEATLHKMEQQIRRYKDKIQDHRRDKPTSEVVTDGIDDSEE